MAEYPPQPRPQVFGPAAFKTRESAVRFEKRILDQVGPTALAPKPLGEMLIGDRQEVGPKNFEDAPESGRIAALRGCHLRSEIELMTVRALTGRFHQRHCLPAAVAGNDQNRSAAAGPVRGLETVQVFVTTPPLVTEPRRGVNKLTLHVFDLRRPGGASFGFDANCA